VALAASPASTIERANRPLTNRIDLDMNDTAATPQPADTPTNERPALPDRLSTDQRSPHFVAAVFEHDIGIRFNDKERSDVEEYCLSEGWIKVPVGKTVDRRGRPLTVKLKGRVEAFYK
jgi:hypothetical protein